MIGSMIVGFLIGLIASAISNRGERMGCIGNLFRMAWRFCWAASFWKLGTDASRYRYCSFSIRCGDFIGSFLES